jgi:predicted nucleotidyltransferase
MKPKDYILNKLSEIEKKYNVDIIYAVESGSRAWGFASDNSDYDIRFLYINEPRWYLSIESKPDTINVMEQNKLFDFAGWDIKKTLTLLLKSNMSLYEWLKSPIIYKEDNRYMEEHNADLYKPITGIRRLASIFFDKRTLMFSYCALAKNNYNDYIENKTQAEVKKYLYIFRTLAACIWLEKEKTFPPITIDKLSRALKEDDMKIYNFFTTIIEDKKLGKEKLLITPDEYAGKWISEKITYFDNFAKTLENPDKEIALLDNFLHGIVSEKILMTRHIIS